MTQLVIARPFTPLSRTVKTDRSLRAKLVERILSYRFLKIEIRHIWLNADQIDELRWDPEFQDVDLTESNASEGILPLLAVGTFMGAFVYESDLVNPGHATLLEEGFEAFFTWRTPQPL